MGAAWSKDDLQKFSGAFNGTAAPKKAPAVDPVPAQDGETPEEAGIAKQQSANAADPTVQQRLNSVAAARAKYFGNK